MNGLMHGAGSNFHKSHPKGMQEMGDIRTKQIDRVLEFMQRTPDELITLQPHADYPHEPGTLYDCAGCEMGPCTCNGETGCVSEHCNAPGHPDGQAQRMVQCSHLFCPEDCPG
jgi:hypothetical protein